MIQSLLVLLVTLSFSVLVQAEFVAGENIDSDDSEVVIENTYISDLTLEEPVFPSRKSQREIANFQADEQPVSSEWQGQLSVVKEIPYSYPWISHNTLKGRVLNEIESDESSHEDTDTDSQ